LDHSGDDKNTVMFDHGKPPVEILMIFPVVPIFLLCSAGLKRGERLRPIFRQQKDRLITLPPTHRIEDKCRPQAGWLKSRNRLTSLVAAGWANLCLDHSLYTFRPRVLSYQLQPQTDPASHRNTTTVLGRRQSKKLT
jgi:hypothetical protein